MNRTMEMTLLQEELAKETKIKLSSKYLTPKTKGTFYSDILFQTTKKDIIFYRISHDDQRKKNLIRVII